MSMVELLACDSCVCCRPHLNGSPSRAYILVAGGAIDQFYGAVHLSAEDGGRVFRLQKARWRICTAEVFDPCLDLVLNGSPWIAFMTWHQVGCSLHRALIVRYLGRPRNPPVRCAPVRLVRVQPAVRSARVGAG